MGIFIYTISRYEWHKLQTCTSIEAQELYHYITDTINCISAMRLIKRESPDWCLSILLKLYSLNGRYSAYYIRGNQ